MKHIGAVLRNRFVTGILVILPITATLWIFLKVFNAVDSILGNWIYSFLGMRIPGLGLLLTVLLIILVGMIASNFIGKRFTGKVEEFFMNFPVVKSIYTPIRDVVNTLTKEDSNNFQKACLVTYPVEGSQSIGFITKEHVIVGDEEMTVVFVPTTPNPTSGFLLYLKKGTYVELDIPVDVALKSIVSLGSISPDVLPITKK